MLNSQNDFGQAVRLSGNKVSLFDRNDLRLGQSAVTGDLNLTANGAISAADAITVLGSTSLRAGSLPSTAANITLDHPDNNFASISILNGNTVVIKDRDGLALGPSSIVGDLAVSTAGAISQTGSLSVQGSTTMTASSTGASPIDADITLSNSNNDFRGTVLLAGANVSVVDQGNLLLGPSRASGTFNATATGDIDQREDLASGLTASGVSAFSIGLGRSLRLDHAQNNFAGGLSLPGTSFTDLTIVDQNRPLVLAPWLLTGNLVIQAKGITQSGALTVSGQSAFDGFGADIDLTKANNDFRSSVRLAGQTVRIANRRSLTLGQSSVKGSLYAQAAGSLKASDALVVNDTAYLTASSDYVSYGDITLSNPDNDFAGVRFAGRSVTLADRNSISLSGSAQADLRVTTKGSVFNPGALTVGGTAMFATNGSDLNLAYRTNDFGSVSILGANNVRLSDPNGLSLAPGNILGNLSVTTEGPLSFALNGGSSSDPLVVGGTLSINAGAAVSQYLPLQVTGATSITAKSVATPGSFADIILGQAGNAFTGPVSLVGGNVSIANQGRLVIGPSSASGLFTASSTGGIDQRDDLPSGISAVGRATFTPGKDQSLLLDHTLNNFQGGLSVVGAWFADLTLIDQNRSIALGDWALTGNLGVQAKGITQSSPVRVAKQTVLNALGADILLGRSTNDFQGSVSRSAQNATITDRNSLDLASSTITGNLTVKAAGTITNSGPLLVRGTTFMDASSSLNGIFTYYDIILNASGNDFNSIGVKGRNVTINDVNGFILLPSVITGLYTPTMNGLGSGSGAAFSSVSLSSAP